MPTHFNTQNSYSEESWGFSITLIPWIQSVWRCSDGLPLNHIRNWANTHSVFLVNSSNSTSVNALSLFVSTK